MLRASICVHATLILVACVCWPTPVPASPSPGYFIRLELPGRTLKRRLVVLD